MGFKRFVSFIGKKVNKSRTKTFNKIDYDKFKIKTLSDYYTHFWKGLTSKYLLHDSA